MRIVGPVVFFLAALLTSHAWTQQVETSRFPEPEMQVLATLDSIREVVERGDPEHELNLMIRAAHLSQSIPQYCPAQYRFHQTQASFYDRHNAPQLAIPHSQEALKIYFKLKDSLGAHPEYGTEAIHGVWTMGYLAGQFVRSGQMDSAIAVYHRLLLYEEQESLNPEEKPSGTYNNIGWAWYMAGQADSALKYHRTALEMELHRPGGAIPNLVFAIQDNIALALFELGRFTEALEVNMQNLHMLDTTSLPTHRPLQIEVRLSNCYLRMGQTDRARAHLLQAEQLYDVSSHGDQKRFYEDLLLLRQDYHHAMGQDDLYVMFQRRLKQYQDSLKWSNEEATASLLKQMMKNQVARAEELMELEREAHEASEHKLELDNERAEFKAMAFLLGGVLLITLLGVGIFIYRSRAKNIIRAKELERTRAELQKHRLSEQLEKQGQDLTNLSLYLGQIRGMNQELADAILEMSRLSVEEQRTSAKDVLKAIRPKMFSGEKTALMSENVDKANSEFFDRLKTRHPDLTPSEVELCGFLKLKMSNKDIAVVKNVQPKSVKMSKYRLRKKLGIEPEEDIFEWIAAQ